MNILFITWNYPPTPGGVAGEVTLRLAEAGNDVRVLVPWRKGQKRNEKIEGIQVHRVLIPRYPSRLMVPLFLLRALFFLRRHDFSVIHVLYNTNCFLLPLLGRIFFKKRKIKYVLHQITFSIAPKQEKRLLENRKAISESGYFDAIITSNQHMSEKYYPEDLRDRLFIVPVGVNLEHFKPASFSEVLSIKRSLFKTDDKILVYEGTFSGRKLETLIRAFNTLLQRYASARLLIIGSGDGAGSLNELSGSLGIEEKVRFTGIVPYSDVARYVSAAEIGISYVPLIEYYDVQTPLKTMEFLACGLPVIATGTKANKDLIRDGYNGLLTGDSEEALADAMFLLIANDGLRKKLAQNARESVTRLNWENIVQNDLIPAYREILQG